MDEKREASRTSEIKNHESPFQSRYNEIEDET
jgi:hypothetical protein